jgi:nucleoside-diphosphate-sugar epimerase
MPVLVTGASGFLGGHLAKMLIGQGEEVFVLVRSRSDTSHLSHLPVRPIIGELADLASLRRAVEPVTRIFHCAACSTDWADWDDFFATNVAGTENLLTAAVSAPRLERFVHVSTTDVYGYPAKPCNEIAPTVDAGLPYNQTKRLGELAVTKAHSVNGLPATILRPATIYGPRGADFTREIASLLRYRVMATIDGGAARGGFTYVENVAKAMIEASVAPNTIGQAYNISDATDATWADYLRLFAAGLEYPEPWIDLSLDNATSLAKLFEGIHSLLRLRGRPLLTRHAVKLLGIDQEFPIGKAQRDFDFSPAVSLEEGIARSVAWIRHSRE